MKQPNVEHGRCRWRAFHLRPCVVLAFVVTPVAAANLAGCESASDRQERAKSRYEAVKNPVVRPARPTWIDEPDLSLIGFAYFDTDTGELVMLNGLAGSSQSNLLPATAEEIAGGIKGARVQLGKESR